MAESKSEKGRFASDLGVLLESGEGADVMLVVGDSQLPAHSQILAARSPVFAATLRNDMREASSRRIEITDIREAVLRQMLWFIYTDTVTQLESVAAELLAVADKYDLPLLKQRCEQQMARDLSVENAAATATLAVLHRCPGLKNSAVQYIARHPEVMATEGWTQMLRVNAEVAVEISGQLTAVLPLPPSKEAPGDSVMPEELKQKMSARLLEAARCGRTREVWALLMAGSPKDGRGASGNTALHLAAIYEHPSTVKCLLDGGLDASAVNSTKSTPLHLAAQKDNTDIIWMLVAAGANVDAQDNQGETPLHVVARRNDGVADELVHVVTSLLLAGARKDIRNLRGKTPESVATSSTKKAFSSSCSAYFDL